MGDTNVEKNGRVMDYFTIYTLEMEEYNRLNRMAEEARQMFQERKDQLSKELALKEIPPITTGGFVPYEWNEKDIELFKQAIKQIKELREGGNK